MIEIRKGDIVEFTIAGIQSEGFKGQGIVLDDNVIEKHVLDPNVETGRVTIKELENVSLSESGIRTFGKRYVTKVIKRREDVKNFWEYL